MKYIGFLISLITTIALIFLLSSAIGKIPPFGKFLSPQHGFWQNAEPLAIDYNEKMVVSGLQQPAEVYFDERMVPHVFAESITDAYFIQGYLHAKFRLWQMEFQIYAASGRLAEILGPGPDSAYLNNDRKMRRMGMVYRAKNSLSKMEEDTATNSQISAYTAGVNSYIRKISASTLPLEYRLLNYIPEKWTNLKTALLLKYLSLDLTGAETDIEFSNARSFFSEDDYNKLYPLINDSASPVIPKGTIFPPPSIQVVAPSNADTAYYKWKDTVNIFAERPDRDNGSNNWVVDGSKTTTGRPILCNDPHLGLNLPSLWYEIHVTTPGLNVYGVSLPGAPAVVLGFNDSIAWGFTNAARDVLDFYKIQFRDDTRKEYWFDNQWVQAEQQIETYRIKGGPAYYDTVAYTVFGPVMYDDSFNGQGRVSEDIDLAIKWKAHDPSNEFKTLNLLNSAKNYNDYLHAITYFQCPGQNFAFAGSNGDIAMWHQGQFPAKWYRQGDFIMPGTDSSYMWQGDIPQEENPHVKNPARGFVSSANQIPADTSYPYYLNTDYDVYRGLAINRFLATMRDITPQDMQKLQNENYNVFAETALPFLLSHIDESVLIADEQNILNIVKIWKYRNDPNERGATIFSLWFENLEQLIWTDELSQAPSPTEKPSSFTLIDALKSDSAFSFVDNINTPESETVVQQVTNAFKKAALAATEVQKGNRLTWSRYKDAGIRHLLRMEPLSRFHLNTGGGVHVINATKQTHGPSWKMVVHMTDEVEAYGIYPGGQSGNPGNRRYDEFVDDWAAGKYYRLWMMKRNEANDRRITAVWKLDANQSEK